MLCLKISLNLHALPAHKKVNYFPGFTLQTDIHLLAEGKPTQHAHKYTDETVWG